MVLTQPAQPMEATAIAAAVVVVVVAVIPREQMARSVVIMKAVISLYCGLPIDSHLLVGACLSSEALDALQLF